MNTAKSMGTLSVLQGGHVKNNFLFSFNSLHRSYALTTRLAKRWISSQLLQDYISEEAIELIVAYLFLSPAPLQKPK